MFWALLITFLITQRKKIKSERIKAKISEWIRYIKHHFICLLYTSPSPRDS